MDTSKPVRVEIETALELLADRPTPTSNQVQIVNLGEDWAISLVRPSVGESSTASLHLLEEAIVSETFSATVDAFEKIIEVFLGAIEKAEIDLVEAVIYSGTCFDFSEEISALESEFLRGTRLLGKNNPEGFDIGIEAYVRTYSVRRSGELDSYLVSPGVYVAPYDAARASYVVASLHGAGIL